MPPEHPAGYDRCGEVGGEERERQNDRHRGGVTRGTNNKLLDRHAGILFRLFRPEFMRKQAVPLSSDAFNPNNNIL
jgi:hypothetical protein